MTANPTKARVAILISGRGSNMQALVAAAKTPGYPCEIALVISNRPEAPGLAWAREQGLPAVALDHTRYESREHFEGQLASLLNLSRIDLVALAGFMRLMTAPFVDRWYGRMINVHPSLLPSFKGLDTHKRALDAGVRVAGCTVHFVSAEMDGGPIIGQAAVPVLANDTADALAQRVLSAEHQLYPRMLALVASGKVAAEGSRVRWQDTDSVEINQPDMLLSP